MDALVPQFSSLTIEQITEAFAKQVVSTAKINITAVIRENLAMWETKLFPIIGAYEISMYEVLADILVAAGCRSAVITKAERSAFVNVVAKAVRRVRSERGELTATQKRKAQRSALSTKAVPLLALGVSSPVAMKAVEVPAAVARVQAVQGANGAGLVSEPMAVSKVAVKAPAAVGQVFDLDEYSFKEQTDRLKTEVNGFYEGKGMDWSADDDELLAVFAQISRTRYIPIAKLSQSFGTNENIKQTCFGAFKIKCKNMSVDLSKHGFQ